MRLVRSHGDTVFSLPGSNATIYVSIKLIHFPDREALELSQLDLH